MFSEMSLSAAAPEDVPATYFVDVQVSERRQSVGRYGRGQPCGSGPPVRKTHPPAKGLFLWSYEILMHLKHSVFV